MADDKKTDRDVLQLGPSLGDGRQLYIRHKPGGTVETGTLKPHNPRGRDEASSDYDGILQLKGKGPLYDVEMLYEKGTAGSKAGPAKVTNNAYRDGWGRIFGTKTVGLA